MIKKLCKSSHIVTSEQWSLTERHEEQGTVAQKCQTKTSL